MATILRRACHACSKAKRKCIPKLPACERCIQKQIKCVYDLEPVQQESGEVSQEQSSIGQPRTQSSPPVNIVYASVESAREASMAAVGDGEHISSSAARPLLLTEDATSSWLLMFFTQVAQDGAVGHGSPFIHPRVFGCHIGQSKHVRLVPQALAILDRLIEIQQLILQSLNRLLVDRQSVKKDADIETIVVSMFTTTRMLWEEAPKDIGNYFNPWNAWVVAESIRRSMFAAIMIRGIFWVATKGVVRYEPFYESFPFDPRSGLWEAATEHEWQHLVDTYGGHHTDLVSYHEFITKGQGRLDHTQEGEFQRMLFVCYHGVEGVNFLRQLDQISK